jgi:hypothetical protein
LIEGPTMHTARSKRTTRFGPQLATLITASLLLVTFHPWLSTGVDAQATTASKSSGLDFHDATSSVFAADIAWLANQNITSGFDDGTFRPDRPISRGQMAAFLSRALGLSKTSGVRFSDVSPGSAFAEDIDRLATSGITTGHSDGTYRPDQVVSRGQMAAFLSRGLELTETSGVRYSDVRPGSTFAGDIDRLATSRITAGYPDGTFRPELSVSRGQMAAFLHRGIGGAFVDSAVRERPEEPASRRLSHGMELVRSDAGLASGWSGRSSGAITTSRNGQVIEGLDVSVSSGVGIAVEHDDVVVRNNRVNHRNGANGIVVASSASNVTVEHNDLEGHNRTNAGNSGSIGILTRGDNVTVRGNHFRGGRDGIHFYGTNSRVVENWVSSLHQHSGAHNDSVFYGGRTNTYANNTIARNRVLAGNSGGIDLYAMYGPVQGVNVLDNLIVGNDKGWGLYGGYVQPLSGQPNYHHHNRDIRIEGNRFTPRFGWPNSRGEGSNAAVNTSQPGNTYKDNRWVGGTTDLQARCGVRQNNCEN